MNNETNNKTKETKETKETSDELASKVSKHAAKFVLEWSRRIGTPVLVGYGAFIIGMFFLPFIDLMFIRPSLYQLFELAQCTILAWIALASIVLPQLWVNRKSYYAYLAPITSFVLFLLKIIAASVVAISGFNPSFSGKPADEITSLILKAMMSMNFGIGFWVVIASAVWLAYKGINKGKLPRPAGLPNSQ